MRKEGYSYDEFGQLEQTGASGFLNEVTYTGSVSDTSTGLQYMNARFYNPSTGRFLSQDSYKGNAYDPWTQHLYAYTGNNPVNFVDPTGHEMSNLQKLKDDKKELERQKKIRQKFVDGYSNAMRKYMGKYLSTYDSYYVDMYRLVAGGWNRNRGIVTELDKDIGILNKKIEFAKTHYDTQDEAAIALGNNVMPESVSKSLEYGGAIYEETTTFEDGGMSGYGISQGVQGKAHSCQPKDAYIPGNCTVVAYFHTHADNTSGYADDLFSDADFNYCVSTGKPLYMLWDTTTSAGGELRIIDQTHTNFYDPNNPSLYNSSYKSYNGQFVSNGIAVN